MSDLREVYEKNKQDYLAPYLLEAINHIELLQDVKDVALQYRKCHWTKKARVELDVALSRLDALEESG